MAALVQTYTPQQAGTVTMLQTRPSGGSGLQSASGQQYGVPQSPRTSFHGLPGGAAAPATYRASGPIQPYAFKSTPSLNSNAQRQQHGGSRPSSSPNLPSMRTPDQGHNRIRHGPNSSMTNVSYNPSMGVGMTGSRDDTSLPMQRSQPAFRSGSSPQVSFAQATPAKTSPDRYRRPSGQQPPRHQGSAPPSGSGMNAVGHHYVPASSIGSAGVRVPSPAGQGRPNSLYVPGRAPGSAVDDTQLYSRQPSQDDAKRLRRRSMHTLDSADYPNPLTPQSFRRPEERSRVDASTTRNATPTTGKDTNTLRLVSNSSSVGDNMRMRNSSSESLASSRSSHSRPSSSANRNPPPSTGPPSSSHSNSDGSSLNQDTPASVHIPPRGSSSDVAKRVINSSPLSRPVTMEDDAEDQQPGSAGERVAAPVENSPAPAAYSADSPAAKQLAAISKGAKSKSKTSRLRRAFSFGSASEFKKAADASGHDGERPEPAKLHKEPGPNDLYDAEQARIAKKQEEGGIGSSIYGARIFSGSTDNLSISSTASSASIMIRKMGRGMKKSTRSLVGLFRPKSIVGDPSVDGFPATPEATPTPTALSMITVEAERERVNVNADPHTQPGGGTGFPHLERNSIDASKAPSIVSERANSSGTDTSVPRKSIIGGDKERAEVLAAVRKGILKRTGNSPTRSPADDGSIDLPAVPNVTDSPNSSAPSTPNDEAQGQKRTDSVAIGGEDYFVSALRLRQDTKSAPGTPSANKRNATFSPRIVFYDTWPSQEYDRRGEIATCNRLTPMLAQQIKEELNTFKMEMEVHENSKVYTHFF